jgi:hypothetical protein
MIFRCDKCGKELDNNQARSIKLAIKAFWYITNMITLTPDPLPFKRVCTTCERIANAILLGAVVLFLLGIIVIEKYCG